MKNLNLKFRYMVHDMIYVIYKFIKVTYIISYIVYMYTYNVYVIGKEGTNGGKEENQWRDIRD